MGSNPVQSSVRHTKVVMPNVKPAIMVHGDLANCYHEILSTRQQSCRIKTVVHDRVGLGRLNRASERLCATIQGKINSHTKTFPCILQDMVSFQSAVQNAHYMIKVLCSDTFKAANLSVDSTDAS